MAYGIGRNIELLVWVSLLNQAEIFWNWNYFSDSIQIYELCFKHKILVLLLEQY